jgi:HEAT repeat protein
MTCFQDFFLRESAVKALQDMGPMAEKEVLPFLGNKDPTIRGDAIRILKEIGTQQSVPALQALASDPLTGKPAQEAIAAIQARSGK